MEVEFGREAAQKRLIINFPIRVEIEVMAILTQLAGGVNLHRIRSCFVPQASTIRVTHMLTTELPCSTDAPEPDFLVRLGATMREGRQRAIDAAAAFERAVPLLTETLVSQWGTGQGTRVRHILWSLYTCRHLINLGDACTGIDGRLAEALSAAIAARLVLGPEVESSLREILQTSGEFTRFDEMERSTPKHLPVVYPPPPTDSQTLRKIAASLDYLNARAMNISSSTMGV